MSSEHIDGLVSNVMKDQQATNRMTRRIANLDVHVDALSVRRPRE
ncbi:hypothetical protein ACIGN6_00940 [Streptomyces sp. NPDC053792]